MYTPQLRVMRMPQSKQLSMVCRLRKASTTSRHWRVTTRYSPMNTRDQITRWARIYTELAWDRKLQKMVRNPHST